MIGFVVFGLLVLGPIFTLSSNAPSIKTSKGNVIIGTVENSRKGLEYYSFRGIRYAEAPTGELRFKPPVPVKSFNDTIDASQDGPVCYQYGWDGESEDCLWVNVYTRIDENPELRPVLVYIHGGAFVSYTGQSTWFGPDYLLDHDIVVVTVNYRLGTLGFFSTGDEVAPGNYGMKDQVEALRWVRDNIKDFGGDPERVTIAGESAGGASVGLHMISPMSRGLFHRAILLSGSATNSWAVDHHPQALAAKQAALLNCTTELSEATIECLRKLPANDIADIYPQLSEWNGHPVVKISPVIEEDNGDERFLVKDPLQSIEEGDVADVPVFIGTTRDEFAYFAKHIIENEEQAADMSANWERIAPITFMYETNDFLSNLLRVYYLGSVDQPITNESYTGLGQLFADSTIIFGVVRSAKMLAAINTEPVYLYQFNYQGENTGEGVYHGIDLDYVFYNSNNHPKFDSESEDGKFVDRFTMLWKNFVETGNPTPEPQNLLNNVTWTPYTEDEPAYLDINKNLTLVEGLYYEDRMSLWESMFLLPSEMEPSEPLTRKQTNGGGKQNGRENGGGNGRTRWWWWFG